MKRITKNNLVFLTLFFSFTLSSTQRIDGIQSNNEATKHFLQFISSEDKFSQTYKVSSVYKTIDYLIFDVEKRDLMPSPNYQELNTNCIFKQFATQENLQQTEKYSKIIFSIKDINLYNSNEPRDPDPIAPLPAPLPYLEIEQPFPRTDKPGDPVAPLPAPLPYYINNYNEYVISHQDEVSKINILEEEKWSDDTDAILKNYFYELQKTCDTW